MLKFWIGENVILIPHIFCSTRIPLRFSSINIFIPKNTNVIIVPFAMNFSFVNGFFYRAVFFVIVEAIVILTLIHERADFDEVMSDFGGFEINVYEFTYAGGVDDITAGRKRVHFGEGGGVFSFEMLPGDITGF